jgi:hypothetical protein
MRLDDKEYQRNDTIIQGSGNGFGQMVLFVRVEGKTAVSPPLPFSTIMENKWARGTNGD